MPSGAPWPSPVVSAHTRPAGERRRRGFTSKTRMCWRAVSLTKSRRPSSEKQSPFGRSKSSDEEHGRFGSAPDAVDALEGQLLLALDAVELRAAVRRVAEVDAAVAPRRRCRSGC